MPVTETCTHGHLTRSCYECECEARLTGLDIENARLRATVDRLRSACEIAEGVRDEAMREEASAEGALRGWNLQRDRLRQEVAAYRASSDHWERLYLGVARKKASPGFRVLEWTDSVQPDSTGAV